MELLYHIAFDCDVTYVNHHVKMTTKEKIQYEIKCARKCFVHIEREAGLMELAIESGNMLRLWDAVVSGERWMRVLYEIFDRINGK